MAGKAIPKQTSGMCTASESASTDAPFRETRRAIRLAVAQGTRAVEMEAAALYAFARARCRLVICFAHVTNRLAQNEGDFEKGTASP